MTDIKSGSNTIKNKVYYTSSTLDVVPNDDNPDLPDAFVNEAILGKAEVDSGAIMPYKRRTKRKAKD